MFSNDKVLGANTLKAKKRRKTTASTSRSVFLLILLMSPLAFAFGENLCNGAWRTDLWSENTAADGLAITSVPETNTDCLKTHDGIRDSSPDFIYICN